MLTFNRFKVKPISGAMGAEIFDIDLSGEINSETWEEIQDAFHHYLVLYCYNQVELGDYLIQLLHVVYKYLPQTKDAISYYELSTPLTVNSFKNFYSNLYSINSTINS